MFEPGAVTLMRCHYRLFMEPWSIYMHITWLTSVTVPPNSTITMTCTVLLISMNNSYHMAPNFWDNTFVNFGNALGITKILALYSMSVYEGVLLQMIFPSEYISSYSCIANYCSTSLVLLMTQWTLIPVCAISYSARNLALILPYNRKLSCYLAWTKHSSCRVAMWD